MSVIPRYPYIFNINDFYKRKAYAREREYRDNRKSLTSLTSLTN